MKNIVLIEPELKDYWYEQKLLSDPNTMDYNAGYDVTYNGYDYNSGCIDFPESKWENNYLKRKDNKDVFFAYIKDNNINQYVGYVNYHLSDNKYECGIIIEGIHRGKGYSKIGLKLLCDKAFSNDYIDALYDSFESDRVSAIKLFESIDFKIIERKRWKKFNKEVDGVIVCLNRKDHLNKQYIKDNN